MSYRQKDVFQKSTKDINFKVFNKINKSKAKALTNHISYFWKCKFNSTTCSSNRKWNNETYQCECKNYLTCKKDYGWNPSTFIYKNGKYLKSIANDSVIECDESISVMDILLTKMTNSSI